MGIAITSLPRDKLPPFKQALLFYNFTSVMEIEFIASLCFFHIYVLHFFLTLIHISGIKIVGSLLASLCISPKEVRV